MDDDDWQYYEGPIIQGSVHDLRDADESRRSRLWGLKSASRAACEAADRRREPKPRKAGFIQRR